MTGALLRGMQLGASTALAGAALDARQDALPPAAAVAAAYAAAMLNLLAIAPAAYAWVAGALLRPLSHPLRRSWARQLADAAGVALAHSALYACVHSAMHRLPFFRPVHRFHHRYTGRVLPTAALAPSDHPLNHASQTSVYSAPTVHWGRVLGWVRGKAPYEPLQ